MVGCISKMNRKRIDSSILDTYNLNTKTLKTISIEWLIFSFNDFFLRTYLCETKGDAPSYAFIQIDDKHHSKRQLYRIQKTKLIKIYDFCEAQCSVFFVPLFFYM